MNWMLATILGCSAVTQTNYVEKVPPGPPTDFKLVVRLYGVEKVARYEADLVVRNGRAYQFITQRPDEVTIFEPTRERFLILDLKTRISTIVTLAAIAQAEDVIREATLESIAKSQEDGTRAGRLAAQMKRDLIRPEFAKSFDPKTSTFTLKNETVDVIAKGEVEPDLARLEMIRQTSIALARLSSVRDSVSLNPASQVATLKALIDEKGYRPLETAFYFRMNGAPSLYRWVYEVVPKVTDRELKALTLVDQLLQEAKVIPYQQYSLIRDGK